MAKIYKTTDIIPLKVDDLVVNISPLSFEQKMQVQAELSKGGVYAAMSAAKLACQYAIKSIKGIQNCDGTDYEVKIENGKLTDGCWDDILNLEENTKLTGVCLQLINGIPKEFVNSETGKKLEGVSIIVDKTKVKKN